MKMALTHTDPLEKCAATVVAIHENQLSKINNKETTCLLVDYSGYIVRGLFKWDIMLRHF